MPPSIDARLRELGITLPDVAAPTANYVPFVAAGGLVYVSGQVSRDDAGGLIRGKLGDGMAPEAGAAAARTCALALIAVLRTACGGDLGRVRRVVKLTGFVNSAPDFTEQPKVVNGCSDLLVEVFGDAGRHARSAIGVAGLPLGCAVEVEGVFEIA
jgi:enamine deaminase RidA (YjgF/YER057c/UK114 family)